MTSQFKTYLFRYEYNGKRWGFDIPATSEADAKARLAKMASASYDGERAAVIYVPGGNFFVRLLSWIRGT